MFESKLRMTAFIIALFVSLLNPVLAENISIEGRVTDRVTNSPLRNVDISIVGYSMGTTTNANGEFSISGLPAQPFEIRFSMIGYKTRTFHSDEIVTGDENWLDVELSSMPIKGKEIVVTATRRQTTLENVPDVALVIPESEIAMTFPRDVGEAVTYLPGVGVEGGTMGGLPAKKEVSIDGLPAHYSIILMNGARIVSSHHHTGADVNTIPPELIERIELIKGAISAQYGSDGLGGVLNIITKKGTASPEMLFTSYGGSQNTFHSSLFVSGPINRKVRHCVFSGWEQSDGAPIIEPVARLNKLDYTAFHLFDRVDVDFSERFTSGVQMFYLASKYPYKSDTNYDSWLITPKFEAGYKFSQRLDLNTSVYYTQWHSERNNEKNEIAEQQTNFSLDVSKNNSFLFGFDNTYRNFRRKSVVERHQNAFGIFVQDEWTPFEKLSLFGAVRYDKVEKIEGVFTPKLSFLYKPLSMLRFRTSVGRGFRAPSVQDLYETLFGHGTHIRAGNKDLQPEYSTGIIGGVEVEPLEKLSFTVNGYYTTLTDMITPVDNGLEKPSKYFTPEEIPGWNPDTLIYIYRRQNIHKATIYGGEFRAIWNFHSDWFSAVSTSYAFNRNENTGESLPYFPGLSLSCKIYGEQPITSWFDIGGNIGVKAVSGRKIWKFKHEGQQQVELDDYQNLSAGVNLKLQKRYEIFVNADNILEQRLETYEDALMVIDGITQYRAGIRINID